GRLDAIQRRHGDVQYDDVRFKNGSFVEQCLPVTHRLDYLKLRLEELCDSRKELLMVVGQQYTNAVHAFLLQSFGKSEFRFTTAMRNCWAKICRSFVASCIMAEAGWFCGT